MLRLNVVLQLVRSCRSVVGGLQAVTVAAAGRGGVSGGGGGGGGDRGVGTSGGCCGCSATSRSGGSVASCLGRDCIATSTTVVVVAAIVVGATCRGAEIFGVLARIGRVAGVAATVVASISLFPESVVAVLRLRRGC